MRSPDTSREDEIDKLVANIDALIERLTDTVQAIRDEQRALPERQP